jgi:hypothetical protein
VKNYLRFLRNMIRIFILFSAAIEMRLLRFGCESVFLLSHFDNPQFYSDASSHNLVTFYWHLTSVTRAHFSLNDVFTFSLR